MPQRKLRGRAAKASYFVPTGNGNYTYIGPLYSISPEANATAKKAGARRIIICICVTVLSLVCGLLPVPGMSNTFYVIIPYAVTLIFAAVMLYKSLRIAYWGNDKLREYVYHSTVKQLPILSVFCAVFACVAIAGEGLCLILQAFVSADLPYAMIFFLSHIAIFALSLLWKKHEISYQWECDSNKK